MRSLNAPNNGQQIHQLFDGQTDELLARVTFSNEGYLVTGVVEDSKHKLPEITDKWPETLAEANRRAEKRQRIWLQDALDYINERMGHETFDALCRLPREIRVLWPAPSSVVSVEEVAASGHVP